MFSGSTFLVVVLPISWDVSYLSGNDLLPDRQSAYRAFRSTETVIARLLSDILTALDAGDIAALALLHLSAAFDTVDHPILLHRLQTSFTLCDSALALSVVRHTLDGIKPSPTQRRQNGVHVVCSTPPPPSSTSHWIVGDRRSFCGSCYVFPRPWSIPGL